MAESIIFWNATATELHAFVDDAATASFDVSAIAGATVRIHHRCDDATLLYQVAEKLTRLGAKKVEKIDQRAPRN